MTSLFEYSEHFTPYCIGKSMLFNYITNSANSSDICHFCYTLTS